MRAIGLFLVLLTSPAFAGVLPITGRHCDDGNPNSAGVSVDTDGLWSEEDAPLDRVVKSGPGWWEVSYKDEYHRGVIARVSLSADKQTLTLTDSDDTFPIILHACR